MALVFDGTNGISPVTWSVRPTSPNLGQSGYNTANNQFEVWSGLTWIPLTSQTYTASYLIAAGGGAGGGAYYSGGGGAGGLLTGTTTLSGGTTYSITVGAGGSAGTSSVAATSGSIIMGDVNGDGYPEIIKGDHQHFSGDIVQHSIEVYTDSNKDGRYKRLDFHPLMGKWAEGYGAARLKLYDYDKDGDLDLFVKFENEQTNSAALQIFNNDGHGIFTGPSYTIDLPNTKFLPAEFDLIDVDNDGDMDIVFNAEKNLNTTDALMYGFGGDGTPNFNNSATINFDQLIYINNGGTYSQCTKGFKKTIPSGSGIVWIKGMKVNNQFKFVCLRKTGNYIRSDVNWNPNTWTTTIIEVYPKF